MRKIALTCVIALCLAACGGSGGGESKNAQVVDNTHVLGVIQVHETEFALTPKTIRIDRFGYYGLEAINDGKVPHALALKGQGLDQRTAQIEPGKSTTMLVFFKKAGAYLLYCPLPGHEEKGMRATVKVH